MAKIRKIIVGYGGWMVPYFDDFLGETMVEQLKQPSDLLLGRKTYEIFAAYWPHQDNVNNPIAAGINQATKYIASRSTHVQERSRRDRSENSDRLEYVANCDGPLE